MGPGAQTHTCWLDMGKCALEACCANLDLKASGKGPHKAKGSMAAGPSSSWPAAYPQELHMHNASVHRARFTKAQRIRATYLSPDQWTDGMWFYLQYWVDYGPPKSMSTRNQ